MRKKLIFWFKAILSLVTVVAAVAFFTRNMFLGTPVKTYQVVDTELLQTIVASGRVTGLQRISVGVEVAGRVKSIPVKEGQKVQRGQLLILLDDEIDRASVAQANTSVAVSEATIRQQHDVDLPIAQEALNQARADVKQARLQLARITRLNKQKYISNADLETAERNMSVASSKLEAARLQVETNQPRGSDTLLASTGLSQAQAALRLAQVKLDQTKVLASAKGTLISRSIEPGDMAIVGEELMVLAVDGDTLIEIQVDEKNLAKIVLGQTALCSADAYPQQRFNAKISYINPSVDSTRGSVEVKLLVGNPPAYLRQDMTVSVDIETSKKDQALVVPSGALHDKGSDSPWVLVMRNEHAVKQEVTLGLMGDDNVEILTGLKEGEKVIPANLGLIKAGQHVREEKP